MAVSRPAAVAGQIVLASIGERWASGGSAPATVITQRIRLAMAVRAPANPVASDGNSGGRVYGGARNAWRIDA